MQPTTNPPCPEAPPGCAWVALALRDGEAQFRAFMDHSPVAAWMKDEEGRYVYVNGLVERLYQVTLDGVRGKTDFEWFPGDVAAKLRESDLTVLATQRPLRLIEAVPAPDGSTSYMLVIKFPFRDPCGRRFIGGVGLDVTEQKVLEERLTELATTDGLTGLKNYRYFRDALSTAFSFAVRQRQPVSVAMVDVDHFKAFNDTFGHHRGDDALCAVAAALRSAVRAHDLVARYGGEEFIALLPATDRDGSRVVAERLRAAVARDACPSHPITVSVGVATLRDSTLEAGALVEEADRALYHSKRNGRNRVTHHADVPKGST